MGEDDRAQYTRLLVALSCDKVCHFVLDGEAPLAVDIRNVNGSLYFGSLYFADVLG